MVASTHLSKLCPSLTAQHTGNARAGRKLFCGGGGGGDTEAHFPNPPPRLLGRRDGRGGSGRGCPTCRAGGGGGGQPNIWLKMISTSR